MGEDGRVFVVLASCGRHCWYVTHVPLAFTATHYGRLLEHLPIFLLEDFLRGRGGGVTGTRANLAGVQDKLMFAELMP